MSTQAGLLTVEEFLKLPEPKEGHIELHHGEVITVPPPKRGHQRIQRRILRLLTRQANEDAVVEIEMAFRPTDEYEVWQADVGYTSLKHENEAGDDEYLMGSPELVVEVLSPSNTVDEINDRMCVCMANGCVSFWVVDPKLKRISVTEGDTTKHYGESSVVSCSLFEAGFQVKEVFQ
jgi:Uma2 family endonuclease